MQGCYFFLHVFLSGYSCNEPGMGPLMRNVKNKICTGKKATKLT